MKNFSKVTASVLAVIVILFAGNIFYLHSLYGSLKEQCIDTARQCLTEADMMETVKRLRRQYQFADTDLTVNIPVDITHRITDTGDLVPAFAPDDTKGLISPGGKVMGLFQSFNISLAKSLREHAMPYSSTPTDFHSLDSIFRAELNRAGLYPETVMVLPADTVAPISTDGLWRIEYSHCYGEPSIYTAYISSPYAHIMARMSGIITTTALIIVALAFIFIYLIRTVIELRTLEEMKDDFTNNMTHELKTPIAIAYSANDTLLNYGAHNDPDRRERYLRIALEQLTRLSGLVENILSMSMERRKALALTMEDVTMYPFLHEIAAAHSLKATKILTINIDVQPRELVISADPTHLANMLNNFIDNAVKYSGTSVTVNIQATSSSISVADNGIGISARHLPLIFNKFYRVPQGNRHNIRGYGIGLYYVRAIAEKMGWTVSAESTVGHGSVFTLKFQNANG